MAGVCSAAYGTIHYKETLKSFEESGHPSAACGKLFLLRYGAAQPHISI